MSQCGHGNESRMQKNSILDAHKRIFVYDKKKTGTGCKERVPELYSRFMFDNRRFAENTSIIHDNRMLAERAFYCFAVIVTACR